MKKESKKEQESKMGKKSAVEKQEASFYGKSLLKSLFAVCIYGAGKMDWFFSLVLF